MQLGLNRIPEGLYMQVTSVRFLLLMIFLCFSGSQAQTSGARFLLWKPSAASMAQGGTGVARGNDAFSAYYNPALISGIYTINAVGSFVRPAPFFKNIGHSFAAVAFPISERQVFALSNNMFWLGKQADNLEREPDLESSYAYHPKLSYGLSLKENLQFGINLGLLWYKLTEVEVSEMNKPDPIRRITVDLGVSITNLLSNLTIQLDDVSFLPVQSFMPRPDPGGINLGFSLSNIGADITVIDDKQADPMPNLALAGFSYVFVSSNYLSLILNSELEKQIHENKFAQLFRNGVELRIYNILSLWGGKVSALDDRYKSFNTIGFGLHLRYFSINFARYNSTFLPTWHFDGAIHVEL